jgi:hypothetical protein
VTPRPRSHHAAGLLALVLAGTSCAPLARVPATLDVATLAARYERQRVPREERLAAARLEATLWVSGRTLGRWPAVQLDLALVGPDAMRARVASLFGTALDLAVRGDSLRAYFPPRRLGLTVDAIEESLGVRAPGRWACRALGAEWNPRSGRWVTPFQDTLWRVTWTEETDSLMMSVGSSGLPQEVELHDRSRHHYRVRYLAWQVEDRTAWPARLEFDEGLGSVRMSCRVDRVQFFAKPDPRWLVLNIPARAERASWSTLRQALAGIGEVK